MSYIGNRWRGTVPLKSDDHEFWRLVQARIAQSRSWEHIASEIGCDVDDLVYWANYIYQPPKKPLVRTSTPIRTPSIPVRDLPMDSPAAVSKQFLAWKRARDGARKAREAMKE